jgi:hypothetical protein
MADDLSRYGTISDATDLSKYGSVTQDAVPGMEQLAGKPKGHTPGQTFGPQPPAAGAKPPAPMGMRDQPDNFWTSPNGLLRSGGRQLGEVIPNLAAGRKAEALSNTIEGAGKVLTPFAIPAAAASPVAALTAAGAGYLGQKGGEAVAQHFGASPEMTRALGDVAGLPSAMAGGKAGGVLARAAAPMAESALGIRGSASAYGATPGKAILQETSGLRPSVVADSAWKRISALSSDLDQTVSKGGLVDLRPAHSIVSDAQALAQRENTPTIARQLKPLEDSVTTDMAGNPFPFQIPARQALDLKRGVGKEHATFKPGIHGDVNAAGKRVYGALNEGIHQAAPGSAELDQRISSLIPVQRRAALTDLNAGPTERIINRATRPTGALAAPLFAFHAGGAPAAALTTIAQEALSSPTFKMAMARGAYGAGKPLSAVPSAIVGQRRPLQ